MEILLFILAMAWILFGLGQRLIKKYISIEYGADIEPVTKAIEEEWKDL